MPAIRVEIMCFENKAKPPKELSLTVGYDADYPFSDRSIQRPRVSYVEAESPQIMVESVSVISREPDELRAASIGWRHEYKYLGKDDFLGSFSMAQSEAIQVSETRFNTDMIVRGAIPKGTFAFCFPFAAEQRYRGVEINGHEFIVANSTHEFDFCHRGKFSTLIAIVSAKVVEDCFHYRLQRDPNEYVQPGVVAFRKPGRASQIFDLIRSGLRDHENLTSAPDTLLDVLSLQLPQRDRPEPFPVRRQAARKAFDILASAPERHHQMAILCRETGVSERSLRRGFKETYGISPRDFLATLRLQKARTLLQCAKVETVTEAATASGFHHLGRFSVRYRKRFGEAPSETLYRCT